MSEYRNPTPVVDVIITEKTYPSNTSMVLMISRKNEPFGWALPGGYVDEGESFEHAAIREAKEEVSLDIWLDELFYVYSDPNRDPRQHNTTTVFIGHRSNMGQKELAGDDACEARYMIKSEIENLIILNQISFDHSRILMDFFQYYDDGVEKKVIFNPMKDVKCLS